MDQLGLVKPVDGFSQGIVVAVADVSHGRLVASFGQALCVFDGHVLAAPVAVMHEPAAMDGPPIMQRLLQCIEDEARLRVRLARHPTMRRAKVSMTNAT